MVSICINSIVIIIDDFFERLVEKLQILFNMHWTLKIDCNKDWK